MRPSSVSGSSETLPGSALGTPSYMSPEQARGDLDSLGPRSDVYSLGATLYCLLTGRPPFERDDVGAVLGLVREGRFPPPRRLDPGLDAPLEAIVLKAMALDPADRYDSARALADDLDRWLADERVEAYPEPWARSLNRWLTRHRTAVTAAAAALLVGLVGLGAVAAVQTAKNAELEEANEAILAQRDRAERREDEAIEAVKRFRDAVAEDPTLKNSPELEGLRKTLLQEPLAFFRRLCDQLLADDDTRPEALARLASASHELGRLTDRIGDKSDAIAAFRESLAIWGRLAEQHPTVAEYQSDLAVSHNNLGLLLRDTGDPEGARTAYEAALAIFERLAEQHPAVTTYQSALGGTLNNLARLDLDGQRFAEARDRVCEAIVWQRKALDTNPHNPIYRRFLGNHYRNLLRAAEGLGDADLAAEARRGVAELRAGDPRRQALDARLAALVDGQPARDNAERLSLALHAYKTRHFAAAARLWADALEDDPSLAESRPDQHPYNASCAAALAGDGQGIDSPDDDAARSDLRDRALGWLRDELDTWAALLAFSDHERRAAVTTTLRHWQADPDLASIRDPDALLRLPESQRSAFEAIWRDVDSLLAEAEASPLPEDVFAR